MLYKLNFPADIFSVKDPVTAVPFNLLSCVVYKFTCAGCNASYIRETFRHILTRILKHLRRHRTSQVFQYSICNTLMNVEDCSESCFFILDTFPNCYQLLHKLPSAYLVSRQLSAFTRLSSLKMTNALFKILFHFMVGASSVLKLQLSFTF